LESTTVVHEARLVWAKIRTDRGYVTGIPNGNAERHWIECLHDLG
jgi:hypothetical protein